MAPHGVTESIRYEALLDNCYTRQADPIRGVEHLMTDTGIGWRGWIGNMQSPSISSYIFKHITHPLAYIHLYLCIHMYTSKL